MSNILKPEDLHAKPPAIPVVMDSVGRVGGVAAVVVNFQKDILDSLCDMIAEKVLAKLGESKKVVTIEVEDDSPESKEELF